MGRFVEGEDRRQPTMLPACLDDYIADDNPVRAVDAFIEELDLSATSRGVSSSGAWSRWQRASSGTFTRWRLPIFRRASTPRRRPHA